MTYLLSLIECQKYSSTSSFYTFTSVPDFVFVYSLKCIDQGQRNFKLSV